MKARLIDRGLLLLTSLAFVGGVMLMSRWLGNENVYSLITAVTICALWFKVARLTKLLREHGIDPRQKPAKDVDGAGNHSE